MESSKKQANDVITQRCQASARDVSPVFGQRIRIHLAYIPFKTNLTVTQQTINGTNSLSSFCHLMDLETIRTLMYVRLCRGSVRRIQAVASDSFIASEFMYRRPKVGWTPEFAI